MLDINSHFAVGGNIYQQAYAISEIITGEGVKEAIKEVTGAGLDIAYIAKYVDDIIIIMEDDMEGTNISKMISILSQHIPNMPITYEKEEISGKYFSIRYLETMLLRERFNCKTTQKIKMKWSRKAFASDRMLNSLSAQDKNIKHNVCKEAYRTTLALTSEDFRMEALLEVHKLIMTNGYAGDHIMGILREVCGDENIDFEWATNCIKAVDPRSYIDKGIE